MLALWMILDTIKEEKAKKAAENSSDIEESREAVEDVVGAEELENNGNGDNND